MPAARPVLGPLIRSPRACTVPGCTATHAARGLCARHYAQARYTPVDKTSAPCPGCALVKQGRASICVDHLT